MKSKIIPFNSAKGYDATAEKENNVIGTKIREARKKRGLTLAQFSEQLGGYGVTISRGAAAKWETGESIPNAYQMVAAFSALDMEEQVAFLMENYVPALNDEGMRRVREYKSDLIASGKYRPAPKISRTIRYIDMPVSNLAVSAGTGAFLDEGNFDMVSFPEDKVPEGANFGVRVCGDSMEPVYHDGQIVWVHECEQLNIGEVGVFICDGEGFLKAYDEQEPDESIADDYTDSYGVVHQQAVLVSYNKEYAPRAIPPTSALQIVGKVL